MIMAIIVAIRAVIMPVLIPMVISIMHAMTMSAMPMMPRPVTAAQSDQHDQQHTRNEKFLHDALLVPIGTVGVDVEQSTPEDRVGRAWTMPALQARWRSKNSF